MPSDEANPRKDCVRFVEDGAERIADGIRTAIKKEVEAEFSERMARANWLGRLSLRWQMRNEIKRRVKGQMPSDETLW